MAIPFPSYLKPTRENLKRYGRAKRKLEHRVRRKKKYRKTNQFTKDLKFAIVSMSLVAALLYFLLNS